MKNLKPSLLTIAICSALAVVGCESNGQNAKWNAGPDTVVKVHDGSLRVSTDLPKARDPKADVFKGEEWFDQPTVYAVNREKAHSSFYSFTSEEDALARDRSRSENYMLLNGTWKFSLARNPHERNTEFFKPGYSVSKWANIQVPGSWQTQGFDRPYYTDTRLSWLGTEEPGVGVSPTVYNPVASYRRDFTTPANWDGKQILVNFQGVESAFYLWVNGHKVGYSEDSFTASEFDITKYLNAPGKKNTIAVQVYRWSDASYLENHDYIRLSGIFRDVALIAKDKNASLFDFAYTTDLDKEYKDATFNFTAKIRTMLPQGPQGYTVETTLLDKDGKAVFTEKTPVDFAKTATTATMHGTGATYDATAGLAEVTFSRQVSDPLKWSAEKPNLYRALITLRDPQGNIVETTSSNVGFRKVEIFNRGTNKAQVAVNGKPIVFRGVNRHEISPQNGRYISEESMIRDIMLMKQYNLNSVRNSHYPNEPRWYELCDEYGLYMMDEANVESDSIDSVLPASDPDWIEPSLDRMVSTIERAKNHPSIIMWSLGNESYGGDVWKILADTCHQMDPTRLVHYEAHRDIPEVDVWSRMYRRVNDLDNPDMNANPLGWWARNGDKPELQCEYAHGMGNGIGNFKDYWDFYNQHPILQGGFIWDWRDQSLEIPTPVDKMLSEKASNLEVRLTGKLVAGKNGRAMDGFASVYNDPSLVLSGNQPFTLEATVKPAKDQPALDAPIIMKGDMMASRNESYGLHRNVNYDSEGKKVVSDNIEFYIYGGEANADGVIEKFSASIPTPADWNNKWHHVAGVYDGQVMKLYLDGKVVATAINPKGIAVGPNPVGIGGVPLFDATKAETLPTFKGLIDSVRIYNRALDQAELARTDRKVDSSSLLWLDFEGTTNKKYDKPTYLSYGGDWDDIRSGNPNNKNFCANGLISADFTVQPELVEVKKGYEEIAMTADNASNGKFVLENRKLFTNLNEFEASWNLTENGVVIESGKLSPEDLDVAPLTSKSIKIGFTRPQVKAGADYFLNVSFALKQDEPYAPAGHEIAHEQFALDFASDAEVAQPVVEVASMPALKVAEDGILTTVTNSTGDLVVTFDRAAGTVTGIKYMGKDLIIPNDHGSIKTPGIMPNFYRAGTDSDLGYYYQFLTSKWRYAGLSKKVVKVETVKDSDQQVTFKVSSTLPVADNSGYEQVFTVYGSGDIRIETTLNPTAGLPIIPEISNMLTMPREFANVTWFGRGPDENYIDRQWGYPVGVYSKDVKDFYTDFIKPQETGNHTDVRWVALTNDDGVGLMAKAEGGDPIEFNALLYTPEQLSNYNHSFYMKEGDITLRLTERQMGLGGDNSWGAMPFEKYQNPADRQYKYTVTLKPVSSADVASFNYEYSTLIK